MKKIGKVLLVIIGIAVYLNLGWMIGTYYEDNVTYVPEENLTTLGKIAAGGWSIFAGDKPSTSNNERTWNIVRFSLGWPFIILFVAGSWLVYAVYYFLWLVFAGGIVKTLGWV